MTRLIAIVAAAVLMTGQLRADLVTYSWNDGGSNSGFFGSFTLDTDRMTPAAGGLMHFDFASITQSQFAFSRHLPVPLTFAISGLEPGEFLIDPTTGAIRSGARLTFGPSSPITGTPMDGYRLTGGAVSFFAPSDGVPDIQFAYLTDNVAPDGEFLASIGRWEATVVPAPPALVLLAGGAVLLGARRLSTRLSRSSRS